MRSSYSVRAMRILITNPHEPQAFVIIQCLRRHASRIVLARGGHSFVSDTFSGMAAYSRFVNAAYDVPSCAADWLAGRLEAENTEREEAYVRRIEEICRREELDVIFPSLDPEVYVFAKNKARFAAQGIVTVVPDLEVLRVPMDKGLTILAARRVGFPCPQTYYPDTLADVAEIASQCPSPWFIKPRFSAHGANITLATSSSELEASYLRARQLQHVPLVQEYIPGDQRQNFYLTVNRDGEILSLLSPRVLRTHASDLRVACKVAVSASNAPYLDELKALVRELGLWGWYTVQTKVDPRDGIPKLLEINPRLGQHIWWRTGLGVNEPLICVQLARGESPTGNLQFRDGVMLLDPFFDLFDLYWNVLHTIEMIARRLSGRTARASGGVANARNIGVLATLRRHVQDYVNLRPKVFCPEVASLLVDPYPCMRVFWHKLRAMTSPHIQCIASRFTRRARSVLEREG